MTSRPSLHSPSPSPLVLLADPPVRLVDAAAMDYLLIEAVNALRASSAVATARAKKIEQEMADAGILPPNPPPPPTKPQQSHRDSIGSTTSRTQAASADDEDDDAVRTRLEAIGLHVGGNFVEKYAFSSHQIVFDSRYPCRLCRDRPLFGDALDAIKFVCKELWVSCWDKQVDNLRTNHRVRSISVLSTSLLINVVFRVSLFYKITLSNPSRAYLLGKVALKVSNVPE